MRRTLAHGQPREPLKEGGVDLARWVLGAAPVISHLPPPALSPTCAVVLAALAASFALACSDPSAGDSGTADAGSTLDAATEGEEAATADGGNADGGAAEAGPSELRVLFIGNSYTYVNDLPGMLAKIAATAGTPPTITTDEVVQGGATLQDHWNNGIAQPKIAHGGYTHVVLQGQSLEALSWGPQSPFFDYAEQFGDLIVAAGAQPTFFVTWARAAGDPIYGPYPGGSF